MNIKLLKFAFLAVIFCNVAVDISHKILLQNIAFKIFDGSEQVVLISIINALILIPFLLFFSISAFLSDKYDKKNVLVYGAVSSFILSIFMVIAYAIGSFNLAMFGIFLLAIQSAIYSPAKFGIIISIYKKENLSLGNSFVQSISMIAILFTMGLFSYIFETLYGINSYDLISSKDELLNKFLPLTYYIVLIALFELSISFLILKKIDTGFKVDKKIVFNRDDYFKAKLLKKNIKEITNTRVLLLSIFGISIFWAISQGMLAVFPAYAKEYLNITSVFVINAILGAAGFGVAFGSFLYTRISKNYIETGSIPIAAAGLCLMIYLSVNVDSSFSLALVFFGFGVCGGLFVVPLNSLLQFNAKFEKLGTVLAGSNFFQSLFMVLVLVLTTVVSFNGLNPKSTIYLLLILTILGAIYTVKKLPLSMVHFFVKFVVGLKYKLEVTGISNIPSTGGLLLLGNHVSWLDWAIIQMATPRDIKFVMDKGIYNKWYLKWFLNFFEVLPISSTSSKSSINQIAKELDEGNVVVLFPEGTITRNGHLGEFKKGFELILKQTTKDVNVHVFYIRGLWESMFSRANKKFIESYRTNIVTVSFSQKIPKELAKADYVKHRVMDLTIESWTEHIKVLKSIPEEIFNTMKEVKNNLIVADSTGMELTGYKFLTVAILFKNLLKTRIKGQNIGLLIPSSAAGAFINTSVLMLGKTAVNINYTADVESLLKCIASAEIQSVVASKKFIQKLKERGMNLDPLLEKVEVFYLEDLKLKIKKISGLMTFLSVKIFPAMLLKALHVKKVPISSNALIMFSSGSEGSPKGIELSHMNILGNTQQIASVLNVNDDDTVVGSLPLFHAFGICVTTFFPLIEGIKLVAHPDPTDGYEVGKLVNKYKATVMCGTSTFFRLYIMNKKVHPLMFESLRYTVAGAEKLSQKVRDDFKRKFGKVIIEGYGTTETSPVAACNLPDILTPELDLQVGNKIGTVGMPLPGTSIKIVDPHTFKPLDIGEEGMVLIGGVQIMKGYLNNEAKTNSVIKSIDGKSWYVTGDKGKFDSDGFLSIVDRYSRFAKLAGEMVSLGAIEEKLSFLIDKEEVEYVATTAPDEKKGEKVIVLISGLNQEEIKELKTKVIKAFDNKLMIPSSYEMVDEIPKLGSGKKDYGKAKKLLISKTQSYDSCFKMDL